MTTTLKPVLRGFAALLILSGTASGQDSTSRGVRIGLTYDPGTRPGIVVLPGRGIGADSVRSILQRDLDNGDRVGVIVLDPAASEAADRASVPNWSMLAKLGAAAAVQVTPTAAGLHLAVYDVAKQGTALVRDYAAPPFSDRRAWRAVVHGLADDLEQSLTGTRGISRTRVVFERAKRLWTVDSDGAELTPITEAGYPVSPSWHPSGTQIAYSIVIPAQIAVLDLATARTRTVASGSGTYISPIYSPDGSQLVYAHGVDNGVDIWAAPAAGGTPQRLSVGQGSDNVSPTFSPDGRRLAFMSARAGHPEIYTMDADGTNVELLTPLDFGESAFRSNPDWAPDGRSVVFQSRIAGSFQLVSINLRDRGLKQLTSDGSNEDPSWAADGRHLVFVSSRSGVKQLWVLDVETGRTRQLTRGGAVRNPSWSPRLSS